MKSKNFNKSSFFQNLPALRASVRDILKRYSLKDHIIVNKKDRYLNFNFYNHSKDIVTYVSCDPTKLSSYHKPQPNCPHEMDYIFFRREALTRFDHDPENYSIGPGSIYSDQWHLKALDRDYHKVGIPLYYLGQLPIQEQHYWKSFNFEPEILKEKKFKISQHTFNAAFLGKPSDFISHLERFKQILDNFVRHPRWWFTVKNPELLRELSYPNDSKKSLLAFTSILRQLTWESFHPDFAQKDAFKKNIKTLNISDEIAEEGEKYLQYITNIRHLLNHSRKNEHQDSKIKDIKLLHGDFYKCAEYILKGINEFLIKIKNQ